MTNANGLSSRKTSLLRSLFFSGNNQSISTTHHNKLENASRVSVGFETNTRYIRRVATSASTAVIALPRTQRKAYVAPDAEVLLTPGAIRQAAQWDLMSEDAFAEQDKKVRISLRERIKKAAHRESESYTLYGVNTAEIFTEEFEIDVMSGAAFAPPLENSNKTEVLMQDFSDKVCNAESGDFSSRRSAAADKFKKILSDTKVRIKDFTAKLNNFNS